LRSLGFNTPPLGAFNVFKDTPSACGGVVHSAQLCPLSGADPCHHCRGLTPVITVGKQVPPHCLLRLRDILPLHILFLTVLPCSDFICFVSKLQGTRLEPQQDPFLIFQIRSLKKELNYYPLSSPMCRLCQMCRPLIPVAPERPPGIRFYRCACGNYLLQPLHLVSIFLNQ